MARRYGGTDYSLVIDSSFSPFTLQEMMTPFLMYKDAYEKDEAAYNELVEKADTFKYLAKELENNPDSQAAQIYKGYADELEKQARDLSMNGLSMNNRRALTSLKRRYKGEIGLLDAAKTAMDKEKELRRTMAAKDPSMLYAEDNLSLDQFLNDRTPNLYNISGTELYNRGALVGKNFSSRVYSTEDGGRTLGGYYRDYVQRMGYTPQQLAQFSDEIMEDFARRVSALPELQQAAQSILDANGVTGNLTGDNLRKAQLQVIRGIVDNAVYNEEHKPIEDRGVISAGQEAQLADNRDARALNAALYGFKKDARGNWVKDENGENVKSGNKSSSSSNSGKSGTSTKRNGSDRVTQMSGRRKLTWTSGNPEANADDAKKYKPSYVARDNESYVGPMVQYDDLPQNIKDEVDKIIGDGNEDMYNYYYKPADSSAWWGGQPELEIESRDIKIVDQANNDMELLQSILGSSGEN